MKGFLEYLRHRRIIKARVRLAACEAERMEINRLVKLKNSITIAQEERLEKLAHLCGSLEAGLELDEGN